MLVFYASWQWCHLVARSQTTFFMQGIIACSISAHTKKGLVEFMIDFSPGIPTLHLRWLIIPALRWSLIDNGSLINNGSLPFTGTFSSVASPRLAHAAVCVHFTDRNMGDCNSLQGTKNGFGCGNWKSCYLDGNTSFETKAGRCFAHLISPCLYQDRLKLPYGANVWQGKFWQIWRIKAASSKFSLSIFCTWNTRI